MCSMKGGTGKTTISFNLSERAYRSGIDVSLLDFDPRRLPWGLRTCVQRSGTALLAGHLPAGLGL